MKRLYKNLPESPGVYIMRGEKGEILYIGKAVNLRRRVSSYFLRPPTSTGELRAGRHDIRITTLVSKIKKIEHKDTNSALEALILEAVLIKKHQPPFNVREKDDKSFLYVGITNDEFPRVLLVRGKELAKREGKFSETFGPFVSSGSLKEALRVMRKIFPWNVHDPKKKEKRACFDYQVGLCPGTCIGGIEKKEYKKTIKNLSTFLSGKTERVVKSLEREMKSASKKLEFERAEKMKRRIFALKHINDTAVIGDDNSKPNWTAERGEIKNSKLKHRRIEGYDISNISGKNAAGSMVVFVDNTPEKDEYRKFAIRGSEIPDDTGMLKEVFERRLRHEEWLFPDLILIDGGIGQVNAIKGILRDRGMKIPVIGMVKGKDRKRTDIVGKAPTWARHDVLVRVRDEAHRFAIRYHKNRRKNAFIPKK